MYVIKVGSIWLKQFSDQVTGEAVFCSDWTHSRSFNSWETAATFATAVGGKVMLVDKPTIGDVLNG